MMLTFLVLAEAVTAFATLAFEVIAARLVAPYAGMSTDTWTSIIAAFLLALALGNLAGGSLAARCRMARGLQAAAAACSLAAGAMVAVATGITAWDALVLAPAPLSIWRVVVFASLPFIPPGFCLGIATPLLVVAALSAARRKGRAAGIMLAAGAAGGVAGVIAALWLMLDDLGVRAGSMSLGEFVLFLAIAGSLTAPVLGFAKAADDLQATLVAAGRLADLAAGPHERMASYQDAPPPGRGVVAILRARFAYGGERPVLSQTTLTLAHGEKVALTGASGLGKTTLAGLIVALRAVHGGTITLDGTLIEKLPLGELRRRIALVPHEIEIFTGTVAENIALGEPAAEHAHIAEAARIACLDTDIAALKGGFDTFLGQGTVELSAGQKQRLGIARALMRRPEVLILDESTSALDVETEGKVMDRLFASLPGTTILAITHRASVAERMSRAIDLSEVDKEG